MARQPGLGFAFTLFLGFMVLLPGTLVAESTTSSRNEVMSVFNSAAENKDVAKSTTDTKFRHQLLFFMGLMLLILVFTTAYFGISMALFGKDVFIPHMISAGLTVFLAMVHAVVAVVWFFPF